MHKNKNNTAERWRQIRRLMTQVSELAEGDRKAFLQRETEDDPVLKQEVEELLLVNTDAGSSIERIVADAAVDLNRATLNDQSLENYKILHLLGEGGMGQVYLAKRDDEHYQQEVAIKVLGIRYPTVDLVQRFRIERQILANLDHPNIAHLIDGGETQDATPFLVMEYVDGMPIDEYCDRYKLTTEQRLQMFCKVCSAVDHAHRNLVIHRDIKPSNILVNDQAEPKLLDFGIAKLLQTDADAMKTQSGARLMSPLNASPEQVKGSRVTVATDIYSLGVLLYQMLSGQHPYSIDNSSALAIEKAICETDPPKPSARLTLSKDVTDEQLVGIADARGTDPIKLRRVLGGDLDNIVLKALDKHADRRYNSAFEFSQDVQRFLSKLPVQARRPSLAYKVQKFVQRNSVPTAVAAIGLMGVLTSIAVSVNRIAEERDIAQLEREKAIEISEFMQNIFESANPNLAAGENTTARELLNIGARDINARLGDDSSTRITMLRVLGEAFYYIGNYERAEELLDSALASKETAKRNNLAEVASAKLALGMVRQYSDEWDDAQALMRAAEREREQLFGRQSLEVVDALIKRAFLVETQGNLDEAVEIYKEGIAIANQVTGQDHEHKAVLMSRLSGLYRLQGNHDEAETLIIEARSMQQRLYGDLHLELADSERQLAGLYRDMDQYDKAEPLYKKVIADVTKILGKDHPEVGNVYNSYSVLLSASGDNKGAIDAAKEFLRITDVNKDGPSIDHSVIYNNIAAYYSRMEEHEQSALHYRLAIETQDTVGMDRDHMDRAYPIYGLGNAYYIQELYEKAEPHHRRAMELFQHNLEESHVYVSRLRCSLAQTLIELNRLDEAQQLIDSALKNLVDNQGEEHSVTKKARELSEEIRLARE